MREQLYHDLQDEIRGLGNENRQLRQEVFRLGAKLAHIRPSWEDAPEWAEMRYVISHWTGSWKEDRVSTSFIRGVRTMEICKDVESRPK